MYRVPRIPPCDSYTTPAVAMRFTEEATAQSIYKRGQGDGGSSIYERKR